MKSPGNAVSAARAMASSDGASLTLYGDIGASMWSDGITAEQVQTELKKCRGPINVYINSAGGSVFEGLAIYSQIGRYADPVTCIVDGLAASIASVIALAGSRLEMSAASLMMIHEASGVVMGNAADMRKCADDLDKVTETIRGIYVARTGMTDKQVGALMAAETWMTAEDCVKQNFADAIVADSEPDEDDTKNAAPRILDTYRNTPPELRRVPQSVALAQMTLSIQRQKLHRSPTTGGATRPAGSSTNGRK